VLNNIHEWSVNVVVTLDKLYYIFIIILHK
jgi:hypothetical protein